MKGKEKVDLIVCLDDPRSPAAEAYRTLRTNIQFAAINKELKSLVVTSAHQGEGKSTTVLNMAVVMAQAKQKVLLIDADLRKPTLHERLSLPNRAGLSNLLIKQYDFEEVVQEVLSVEGLSFLAAGLIPPNPADLLSSERMTAILQAAREQYDMILIDTSPVLPVTDAQLLSRQVDGVLLVIQSGKATAEHVEKAKSLLDQVGGSIIGTLLNRKKEKVGPYSY